MSLQSDKVAFITEMDSHVVCGLVLVPRMKSRFEVYISQNSQTADLNVIRVSSLYVSHMYNTSPETVGSILVLYCFWSINYFSSRTTQDLQFRQTDSSSSCKFNYSTPRLVSLQLDLLQQARSGESNIASRHTVDTFGIFYCRLARSLLAPQFYPFSNEQVGSTYRSLVLL